MRASSVDGNGLRRNRRQQLRDDEAAVLEIFDLPIDLFDDVARIWADVKVECHKRDDGAHRLRIARHAGGERLPKALTAYRQARQQLVHHLDGAHPAPDVAFGELLAAT